jgi:hypothetical protein
MLGSWAGDGKPADAVTLLSAIKQRIPAAKVVYAKGVAIDVPGATGNFDARPATTSNAGGTNVTSAADIEAARNATTPVGPNSIQEAVNALLTSRFSPLARLRK